MKRPRGVQPPRRPPSRAKKKRLLKAREALLELDKDVAMREELLPKVEEHTKVQERLLALEALRERHREMQARQKEDAVREQAIEASISRTKKMIDDLHISQSRQKEIASCPQEEKRCKIELADLVRQRELQKELDGLLARKNAQEERLARLRSEAAIARTGMEGLQSIEEKEAAAAPPGQGSGYARQRVKPCSG